MALSDYLNGPAYRMQAEDLEEQLTDIHGRYDQLQTLAKKYQSLAKQYQSLAKQYGAMDVIEVQKRVKQKESELEQTNLAIQSSLLELETLAKKSSDLRDQILVFEEALLLESFALYVPKFKLNASHEHKTRLDTVRERQKAMIRNEQAASGNTDWEVNGSKAEGRKLVNDMIKLVIRSFNNEADYCVDNVKFDNIALGEKRIRQSFATCNRLGRIMTVRISDEYLDLKLDELRLSHEYQVKKQDEKEEAKRLRAELREQQKVEKEIREAREKIEKDRKHFATALRDLNTRLEKTDSVEEKAMLLVKIAEVESGACKLDNEEKVLDYREQNAKAGYVYVISNIGAFGKGVYKIGMTRRLDPMERIDELGDASVPFWFDVHAMIFSDNAPALEAKLHERFATGRLNKVNGRKEFFRADIVEIEAVIRANYDAVVDVTYEAAAEQYRESLRMGSSKAEMQQAKHIAAHA